MNMECYARENLVYLNFPDLQFALNCSIATFNFIFAFWF